VDLEVPRSSRGGGTIGRALLVMAAALRAEFPPPD
jgi:hypothetical protein